MHDTATSNTAELQRVRKSGLSGQLSRVLPVLMAMLMSITGVGAALLTASPASASTPSTYYWVAAANGTVYNFGNAPSYGSAKGISAHPVVGIIATPDNLGYWEVASDGGVFSFGDAGFYGSVPGILQGRTLSKPVVGMVATADGKGYWLVASDGGVFAFGDAGFYGSAAMIKLSGPVVGMAATPDGQGYWLVASDGGVFTYGDAVFAGTVTTTVTGSPVGIIASGTSYIIATSRGGGYNFPGSNFNGSLAMQGTVPNGQIVGISPTADAKGYYFVGSDGGVFTFGDAVYYGSIPASLGQAGSVFNTQVGVALASPIVGFAS